MPNWNNVWEGFLGNMFADVAMMILGLMGTGYVVWHRWLRKKVTIKSVYDWDISIHGSNDLGVAYILSRWCEGDIEYEYKIDFKNATDDSVTIKTIITRFTDGKEDVFVNDEQIDPFTISSNSNAVLTISSGISRKDRDKIANVHNVYFDAIIAGSNKRLSCTLKDAIKCLPFLKNSLS